MVRAKRPHLSTSIATELDFRSNLQCCICPVRGHHIHHIDGDHSNNVFDNLVLLCFMHHDEAEQKGGLSRRLAPGTIRRYRDEWYRRVEVARERPTPNAVELDRDFYYREGLAALAAHEVAKLDFKLRQVEHQTWQGATTVLSEMHLYAANPDVRVRLQLQESLYSFSCNVRFKMPITVAMEVSSAAQRAMPEWSLTAALQREPDPAELQVFELALQVGSGLGYDGAKYLDNISVVDAGAWILWKVLRAAHLNNMNEIKTKANEAFDLVVSGAQDGAQPGHVDAIRWVEFMREDAHPNSAAVMPRDIMKRIHASRK